MTGGLSKPSLLRVVTLNAYGLREAWPDRRKVIADGLRRLDPDLMAFQEVIVTRAYDQVADLTGGGYHVVHHSRRQSDGQGISIASRWPVEQVHEVDLPTTPRSGDFAYSALVVEVAVPEPYGRVVFVDHLPDWQLGHEYEREVHTLAVARFLEKLMVARPGHVVLAGDLDATPEAATVRFWTGLQSLSGVSVCYRDLWAALRPGDPGHTFTPENGLVANGTWHLEPGRRIDYLFVRCAGHGPTLRPVSVSRIFDRDVDGVWASDHFGVLADLSAAQPGD